MYSYIESTIVHICISTYLIIFMLNLIQLDLCWDIYS